MKPSKVESSDPRLRNVHLRSIYREAEEYDVGPLLRKCITLSSLHNLLLGQDPFIPSWIAIDGDTKSPEFWIETLTEVSARSNDYICAGAAPFHDLLEGRSQALCTSHALAHLRKNLNLDSQINRAPNANGKRPRSDTNGPPLRSPQRTGPSPKALEKPRLTLRKWLEICDGSRTSWKNIHAEWNQMISRSKSAKIISWDNLEGSWELEGLTLSLGYFTDITIKLARKCSSLISELLKGRSKSNNTPPPSYIPLVRGLDDLWPAAKNTEFERCIQEVVHGNFRPQAIAQLLGYILELARIIKGSTITVPRKSQQAELKKAEALGRRQARQLKEEQMEKDIKKREELCRQAEENFGRDTLALDDERASVDMVSAKLREAQAMCDERERTLAAKEAFCADRENALAAKEASCAKRESASTVKEVSWAARNGTLAVKEASYEERQGTLAANEASYAERQRVLATKETTCTERRSRIEKAELGLRKKLETFEANQKLLLEGQRSANNGDDSHARDKAAMTKRETANIRREKNLMEREQRLDAQEKNLMSHRAWISQKGNAATDREKVCATKEAEYKVREEALFEGQATVASERQELETQTSALRQNQALYQKAKEELKAREEALYKGQATVASERQELETQRSVLRHDQVLYQKAKEELKAREKAQDKERAAVVTERREVEVQKWALREDEVVYQKAKGELKAREEAQHKERAAIASDRKIVDSQRSALKQDLTLHREGKKTMKANSEALAQERAALLCEQKNMAAAQKDFENKKSVLRAEQVAMSHNKQEVATTMKTLESEKLSLGADLAVLSREKEAAAAKKKALEIERLALSAEKVLYEKDKNEWREKVRINLQQVQEMERSLSTW
ncbi:hypothetical protein V501_03971 [Pseudogymnoascus sp. VKM F-4519 (FW-2642)]|nr:hypothetical protein V501_03971 [Pseudogymnoascus sp. VKM F-4519 (FW-2642)]